MPLGFTSAGINGYVGKKTQMRRRRHRRGWKGRLHFTKAIEKIISKKEEKQSIYSVLREYVISNAPNTCGKQAYATVCEKLSGSDVNAIVTQMNTVTGLSTSSLYASQFSLNAFIMQIAMKNQEQTNAIVDLYLLSPRIATQKSPETLLSDLTGRLNNGTISNADLVWGMTPFQVPNFCECFKVLSKTRYLLAPGACELVEVRQAKPKKVDIIKYYGINQVSPSGTTEAVPGYTLYWFAMVRGEPTNDATTKTNVSTSSFKVDFVVREDYHYSYDVSNLSPYMGLSNSLSAVTGESSTLIDTGATVAPPAQS